MSRFMVSQMYHPVAANDVFHLQYMGLVKLRSVTKVSKVDVPLLLNELCP